MTSYTPQNIKARKVALWICSSAGLIFDIILFLNSSHGPHGQPFQTERWLRFRETFGHHLFEARNPIAVILVLMLFTGLMHTFRKELRIPAIVLSLITLAALLFVFLGGINSDY